MGGSRFKKTGRASGPGKTLTGVVLVIAAVLTAGCGDFSCWVDLTESTGPTGSTSTSNPATGEGSSPAGTTDTTKTTTPTPTTIQTPASSTTQPTATTTTHAPVTTTTLSALETYKIAMRAWKSTYAADMQHGYDTLRAMRNPIDPSDEEVAAARRLADLMDGLVANLEAIAAPASLASPHAAYLASLKDMHGGVDRLAAGLEKGGVTGAVKITGAFAAIYAADKDGKEPRTALEQALGFSLTSADRTQL